MSQYYMLTVLSFVVLVSCTNVYSGGRCPTVQRATAPIIPEYPGWTQVKRYMEKSPTGESFPVITFLTRDDPATVIAYYQEQLGRAGWNAVPTSEANNLIMDNDTALPLYGFSLTSKPIPKVFTKVEIRLTHGDCWRG